MNGNAVNTQMPATETNATLRLTLATDDQSAAIRLERRGNDIFIVDQLGDILAALVQMGTSSLSVAVA